MASLEQGIRSILIADTDVSALVVARVFPWMRQQGTTFPAIVYELDGIEPEQGLDGYQSLTRAELSISNIAETYGGAKTLTGTPTDGVAIKSLVHDNDIGIVEDSQIGNSRGVTVIESSYIIWYSD